MRMPPSTLEAMSHFGRYVARRLRRKKLDDLASEAKQATTEVKRLGREVEDIEEAEEDAYADRDGADDDADEVAKRHRQTIEGRGTRANTERPYTDIYPNGIEHYTKAPLDQQVARYGELTRRYAEFLPEGDPVRAEAGLITAAVAEWKAGGDALVASLEATAIAKSRYKAAVDAWELTMERLFHRLAERFGEAEADRFFPRSRRGRKVEPTPSPS